MFLMSMEELWSFPITNKSRDLCICRNNDDGSITETITCTDNNDERNQCNTDKNRTTVQKDTCFERHNRRKRSLSHSFTYIPHNLVLSKRKETKMKKVRQFYKIQYEDVRDIIQFLFFVRFMIKMTLNGSFDFLNHLFL